jgi:hypothetical protein
MIAEECDDLNCRRNRNLGNIENATNLRLSIVGFRRGIQFNIQIFIPKKC